VLCCRVNHFSDQELGIGLDLAAEIRNQPEVMDLLVSFAWTSIVGNRITFVFPTNVSAQTKGGKILTFMEGGQPSIQRLQEVMNLVPSIKDMAKYKTSNELRAWLDQKHVLVRLCARCVL
jgi:hypothetical protein